MLLAGAAVVLLAGGALLVVTVGKRGGTAVGRPSRRAVNPGTTSAPRKFGIYDT